MRSWSPETEECVRGIVASRLSFDVNYIRSERRALPWNRWLAFLHTAGDIVLFLDDDVRLAPGALSQLEQEYERLECSVSGPVAGVGFQFTGENGDQPARHAGELREWWLGTSGKTSGTMTPGGLPVSSAGLQNDRSVPVDHLWGGAMSYRREVLVRIGFLERLAALYDIGIGRGEDIVLSAYARRHGSLYLITRPLALHPVEGVARNIPYATGGWLMGLSQTWGRAHTLRWTASNSSAYRSALLRVVSLELARCIGSIMRTPWHWSGWQRLAGVCYGITLTMTKWRKLPGCASSSSAALMRAVGAGIPPEPSSVGPGD